MNQDMRNYITIDYPGCWYGAMPIRFLKQMIAAMIPGAHVEIKQLRFVEEDQSF